MQLRAGGIPVAVVTHSMGGLVARAALRSLGSNVVSRLVTIASPHHGTVVARLFPQLPFTRMRPDSPWLRTLNEEQEAHLPVPVTSIYSLEDALVAPARSAILSGARLHELRGVGHLSLLRSRDAFAYVRAALEAT
jgi:pimeloyl-ACP methyl ester carboxylesterase